MNHGACKLQVIKMDNSAASISVHAVNTSYQIKIPGLSRWNFRRLWMKRYQVERSFLFIRIVWVGMWCVKSLHLSIKTLWMLFKFPTTTCYTVQSAWKSHWKMQVVKTINSNIKCAVISIPLPFFPSFWFRMSIKSTHNK